MTPEPGEGRGSSLIDRLLPPSTLRARVAPGTASPRSARLLLRTSHPRVRTWFWRARGSPRRRGCRTLGTYAPHGSRGLLRHLARRERLARPLPVEAQHRLLEPPAAPRAARLARRASAQCSGTPDRPGQEFLLFEGVKGPRYWLRNFTALAVRERLRSQVERAAPAAELTPNEVALVRFAAAHSRQLSELADKSAPI
jgi:hypothetical protein